MTTDRKRTGSGPPRVIRKAAAADLPAAVEVHLESFPTFFLSYLGRDFLFLLYKNILHDPGGIFLVAQSEGRIAGFVAGVEHQGNFYSRIAKEGKWSFARAAFVKFLRKPTIAPRLFRALIRPKEARGESVQACLMSIAVSPESENQGIGGALVNAFCAELVKRGAPAVCLTTDQSDNERVNRFYRESGFVVTRTFVTREGRTMHEYVKNLASFARG